MFLELLQKRRSIRQFSTRQIEQEKIDILLEAMLRSPSSRSLNPWHFVVVDDKATIEALASAKPHGAAFMKNSALAIVVCADPAQCDVWIEDCSIASIILHLAAESLGLGSCWLQIRLRQHDRNISASHYVAELLGLSEGMEVEAVIALGYPEEQKKAHEKSTLLYDRVSYNRYSQSK